MFKNFLKVAARNLWKNKGFSAINIIGLATGLATCLLIFLYVLDELSYDRYNENADRIYRIDNEIKFAENHFDLSVAPAPMGPSMAKELPAVEKTTRLRWYGSFSVKKGNENLKEERVGYADSTLFDVFTLPMLAGDSKTALKDPHSLVITETIAKKYFNSIDVVGKSLLINDTGNYKITGVIKDIPAQSHFHFNFFVPLSESPDSRNDSWLSNNYSTYVLLKKNTAVSLFQKEVNKLLVRYVGPQLQQTVTLSFEQFVKNGDFFRSSLMPLTKIHLHSNKTGELWGNGNIQFVYIFSAIALFILLIACVNFMNLSTARSANRAKEVGVRKVLGSVRKYLIGQFLTESVLISFIALIFAILFAWLLLPLFNQLSGKSIAVHSLFSSSMLASLFVLMLAVGLLAGSYPAFFLSSFQPIVVLKGKLSSGLKRSWLRNALVVLQFFISISLIIGTIVIYNQLSYIRNKDVGFDRNQVIVINNTSVLGEHAKTFRDELLQINGVKNASMSSFLPVNYYRSDDVFFASPTLDPKSGVSMQNWTVDENYLSTLDIKLLQGRNFSDQFATDSTALLINESAARFLGGKDIINKKLYRLRDIHSKGSIEYHIIGIIKDFNFSSLRDVVTPLCLLLQKDNGSISVRISTANISSVINQIKGKWQSMSQDHPFDYQFMDEQFNNLYTTEQRTGNLFIVFAVLAILIACLGLFGLVTYAAEQRTKEIGIRKVLGASIPGIVTMIAKDFLKLVLIASVVAFPVAWWAMHKWLQDFAYRAGISWWIFVVAGLAAVLIALITVSFQAIKAAIANPVKSLRTE